MLPPSTHAWAHVAHDIAGDIGLLLLGEVGSACRIGNTMHMDFGIYVDVSHAAHVIRITTRLLRHAVHAKARDVARSPVIRRCCLARVTAELLEEVAPITCRRIRAGGEVAFLPSNTILLCRARHEPEVSLRASW